MYDLMNTNSFSNSPFLRPFLELGEAMNGLTAGFPVDLTENGEGYDLTCDLPGVTEDNLHLDFDRDVLSISCDMNTEKKENSDGYVFSERRTGHMKRSFRMPDVNADAITASFQDGVLHVSLPKMETHRARTIAISGNHAET